MQNDLAINYWVLGGFEGEVSPFEAIDSTVEFGLDGLELTFGDVLKEDIRSDECIEIKEYAKKCGIKLRSLATGFYWGCSLASNDLEEREKAINFTKKYINVATWLGVDRILLVPGAVDVAWDDSRPVMDYQSVWNNSVESLKALLPFAEKAGVSLCLENVWNKFLLSPIEFKLYLDQFDSEYIGIYFDTGNATLNGFPEHWIPILGKYIKAVHFKNFTREDCGGVLHGFGEDLHAGDVNFEAVKKALENINYSGPITAEMIPFSRLPNLVLPDMDLAKNTANDLKAIMQ